MAIKCCSKSCEIEVFKAIPDPFVYYKFDAPVAATTPDAVGTRHLTVINSWTSVASKSGFTNLMSANASASRMWYLGDTQFFFGALANGFTGRCWYYKAASTLGTDGLLARVGYSGGADGWAVKTNFEAGDTGPDLIKFEVNMAAHPYQKLQTSSPLSFPAWHHIVWQYDKPNLKTRLKIDNGPWDEMGVFGMDDFNPNFICNEQWPIGFAWAGSRMDELCIWRDVLLTDDEITYDYNSGAGRTYPF